MARREAEFQTIRSEGGLLPSDLLRRLVDSKSGLDGTKPEDYGLAPGERLNESITQSWNRLQKHWTDFRTAAANLPADEAGTGLTNDKWTLPLLRELGFGFLTTTAGPEVSGRTYPISRFHGPVPIHLVGCGVPLDRRSTGVAGAARVNPHGLVQEFLNRSADHLWAIVSNGLRLRVLRDNQALSRQSFLEFDLEALFTGEVYCDFVVLWLVAHATRFNAQEGGGADSCWLERWAKEAAQQGTRALNDLRGGVERALQILGEGFTAHPKNLALRERLRTGDLSPTAFHGQLLRVVYRLIFLFVAKDRPIEGLPLLHPRDDREAAWAARQLYDAHYSTGRLRDMASRIKGSRHGDLWRQFQVVAVALFGDDESATIRERLALPALGSFLWNPTSTSAVNDAELTNNDLLEALRHLAFTHQGKVLRPVDYRNLGSEELGGVYESLLGLTPQINADGARFTFAEFAGNERKTSGSYYTPDSLVQCLLDSALDPMVVEATKGKSGTEAEKAILELKICDPAVGSGHFLVGAAHRLARHLSRVRSLTQGESEPSPLLYQHALRDVIGRCLYGVDISAMAAELCKVSLWLEALEPGKPLSFLDHHIRVGNSLLGAAPDLIVGGLPDDAFTALVGDDKKACAVLKRRNRSELRGLGPLFAQQSAETQASLQRVAAALQELPDNRPEEVLAKELAFRRAEDSEEHRLKKGLADAWCAAFLIAKYFREPGREGSASGVTQGLLNDFAGGHGLPADVAAETERLSKQYQFFHWHLAFPEAFARGGFDCVLGNPPWEHTELKEKEWFAECRPDIASARTGAERKRGIEALRTEDPALYAAFIAALREHDGVSQFLGNSARYPFCGHGRINLYAVFAETMRTVLNDRGRAGCVLPTGIATDDTTKLFFQDVVKTKSLISLFDFENKESLFPGVHAEQKFCLFTVGRGTHPLDRRAEYVFFAHSLPDLSDPSRRFFLSSDDIALVNPNTYTCPIFRSNRDAELTKAIYRRVPVLIRETQDGRPEENPWGIKFRQGLFNMTSDSHLFRRKEQLEANGWRLEGNVFSKGGVSYLPLYEGKLTESYNHRFATFDGVTENDVQKGNPRESRTSELCSAEYSPTPRSWVADQDVEAVCTEANSSFLSFHRVANPNNERTALFAFVPRQGVGDSLFLIDEVPTRDALLLCALCNSFVFDFVVRQKVGSRNFSFFIAKQIAVQSPSALNRQVVWGPRSVPLREWLQSRVLELTYNSWDLKHLARACGLSTPPFRWDSTRRFLLRCELDAAIFHIYLPAEPSGSWLPVQGETDAELEPLRTSFPTPRDAVAYIMDTFLIGRRKDEGQYGGEYRTKRVILEMYDAMQNAMRSGRPYKTRLDPPPADPSVAHTASQETTGRA